MPSNKPLVKRLRKRVKKVKPDVRLDNLERRLAVLLTFLNAENSLSMNYRYQELYSDILDKP